MQNVVIVDALRTPTGTYSRSLRDVTVEDLGALVLKEIVSRNKLDAGKIDLVTMGNVVQTSEAPNLARVALLKAGLPYTIPGYSIHINCGSGLQAVNSAFHAIAMGDAKIAIGGGGESMSTAPYLVRGPRFGMRGSGRFIDYLEETGFNASSTHPDYAGITMGITAENVAEKYGISREEQDRFALQSQQRAVAAIKEGKFDQEIVPVPIPNRKGVKMFSVDEHPREETTIEGLAKLGPLFKKNGTVTAGNACGLNDGAAAILLMEEKTALEMGYKPLVRVVSQAVSGVHPAYMGMGPVPLADDRVRAGGDTRGAARPGGTERGLRRPGAGLHHGAEAR